MLVPGYVLNHALVLHVDGLGLQALPGATAAAAASVPLSMELKPAVLTSYKQNSSLQGLQEQRCNASYAVHSLAAATSSSTTPTAPVAFQLVMHQLNKTVKQVNANQTPAAHPVGAWHPADIPQADLRIITAAQQVPVMERTPGQAVSFCLVPREPQVWPACAVRAGLAVVLGVVKHVHLCADCLSGYDERVLRHVAAG
jgi:hypothetical protein